jgi:hypothetical protein
VLHGRCERLVGVRPVLLARLLLEIATDEQAREADRIAAIRELLDRGWGKAPAFANIEGADPLGQDEVPEAIQLIADELREGKAAKNALNGDIWG